MARSVSEFPARGAGPDDFTCCETGFMSVLKKVSDIFCLHGIYRQLYFYRVAGECYGETGLC